MIHLAMRTVQGRTSLKEIATDRQTLCSKEESVTPSSVFLSDEVDKIKKLHPHADPVHVSRRIHGGKSVHGETCAYLIKGAKLRKGGFYKNAWARYFPYVKPPKTPVHRVEKGPAAIASSFMGTRYFGHKIHDDAAIYLLAEKFGEPISVRTESWPHAPFYARVFEQDWAPTDAADFNDLYVFFDNAQNSHRVARYEILRQRIRKNVTAEHPLGRVYIRRGDTGAVKRIISNEKEVISALEQEGFRIVDIVADPIEKIARTLLDAQLVVSVEGSQITHAFASIARPGGLLAICSPFFFGCVHRDWTAPMGIEYGFVVGESNGDKFKVDTTGLLKTVDLMMRRIVKA